MVEPSQHEVDRYLDSSIQMFERVQVGEVAPLAPRRPKRILLTLDGSSQDSTSTALAAALRNRFSAEVSVLAACSNGDALAAKAQEQLGTADIVASKGERDSLEQILAATHAVGADLVVVPCPFGRDFEQIGPDSAGTVVDVLLARSPVPLLVVRQPFEISGVPFDHVTIPVAGENHAAEFAAGWAAGLVAPGGRVELLLVIAEEYHEQIEQLLSSLDPTLHPSPEAFSAALQKAYVRLHRAMQKTAAESDFVYTLSVEKEETAHALLVAHESPLSLVAVPVERPDHFSEGLANRYLRNSRQPVLIAPQSR